MSGVFEREIKIFFHLGAEEYWSSAEDDCEEKNEAGTESPLNECRNVPVCKTEISEEGDNLSSDKHKELTLTKPEVTEEHNGWCEENQKQLSDQEDVPEKFQCEECDYVTDDRANYTRHATAHWDRRKQFKCKICGDSFWWRSQLWEHVKTHGDAGRFACPHCEISYSTKQSLHKHLYEKHEISTKSKCGECGFVTRNDALMEQHVLKRHSGGERTFRCAHCAYSSHRKGAMGTHVRIHLNAKTFKCDSCGFATASKSCLDRHTLVKHSGQPKKYVCDDCGYSTHIKEHLQKHINRMHTRMN